MTNQATTTETVTTTDSTSSTAQDGPKELRAALDREKARREQLEGKLADQVFEQLGLSRSEGVGKAIDKLFDGDKTDREAVEAYARDEFNWTPNSATPTTPQQQVTQPAQNRVDTVTAAGVPVQAATSLDREIEKATSEGRWRDVTALQLQKARELGII